MDYKIKPSSHILRKLRSKNIFVTLAVMLLLSAALFILWTTKLPNIPLFSAICDKQISFIGSISEAGAFVITFTGILFLIIQINISNVSRNFEIFRDIFEKTTTDEQIRYREIIYLSSELDNPTEANIKIFYSNSENKEAYKKILDVFDYYGLILKQTWISEEEIIDWLSPIVVKVWKRIKPVLDYQYNKRKEFEPHYYIGARYLAQECIAYRKRKFKNWTSELIDYSGDY
jgi:hypothetical protein